MTEQAEAKVPTILDNEAPQIIEDGVALPQILTEDFIKQFEKGIKIYQRWLTVCYSLTAPRHWIKHGDRYSLQSPGAEALMNPLGISYGKPEFRRETREDETGKFYIYWCEGTMESRALGRRGFYIGYCDSRDQFFNNNPNWDPITGEGDIKKSSYSNWLVNGVSRIAGIRSPDPQSLEAAGLDLKAIPSPEFKEGLKEQKLGDTAKSKLDEIKIWLMTISDNDKERAAQKLKELTAFKDYTGAVDPRRLSERQIEILHPKLKKLLEAHEAQGTNDKPEAKEPPTQAEQPSAGDPSATSPERPEDPLWVKWHEAQTREAKEKIVRDLMLQRGKKESDYIKPVAKLTKVELDEIFKHLFELLQHAKA